jgi:DNA-binding SARP family transcriptional activator
VGETARLRLLGGFEFQVGGQALTLPLRVQRLVAFLALHGQPLHRAYVSGRLWTDTSQAHAFGSLRATLWSASRLCGPLIEASSTHIGLSPRVRVDAHALATCARRVMHDAAPIAPRDFDRLVRAGDLLPDWYEDWVRQEQERLHELRLLALEHAAKGLLAAGRNPEATIAGLAAVGADPLRESAYCVLIHSYVAAGNTAEASRHARAFCGNIRQLGFEPSLRIQGLLGTIQEGRRPTKARSAPPQTRTSARSPRAKPPLPASS